MFHCALCLWLGEPGQATEYRPVSVMQYEKGDNHQRICSLKSSSNKSFLIPRAQHWCFHVSSVLGDRLALLHITVCTHVCAYGHVYGGVRACVCMREEAGGQYHCLPQCSPPVFGGRVSHSAWSLAIQLDRRANKPWEFSCLCLPSARMTVHRRLLYMGPGAQAQVLMHVQQSLAWMSHLLSPLSKSF